MDKQKKRCERMVNDLEAGEVATLKGITEENLQVEVLADWEDDHERCVGVRLNGVEVSFWWLTFEAAAAFAYPDSPLGRKIIMRVLEEALEIS